MHNKYGCKPPVVDVRDYKLTKASSDESLPKEYSLENLPNVKNQKSVSSCVAHTTSSILEYHNKCNDKLSTNFIYGIQNKHCGHDGSGMYLRDACKIVKDFGDMLEEDCPGNTEVPESWDIAESSLTYEDKVERAKQFIIKSYFNCSNETDIKRAIYKYGPVLCSIKWYDTFKCDNDGILNGDKKGDYGYHAVMIYGWDENGFKCQNSWGNHWGNNGRFILPYSIGVAEAKGLVDEPSNEIKSPIRNDFMDIIYKIINFFANLFKN